MKNVLHILLLIILSTHGQSILHFGIGLGGSGGIETSPYSETGSSLGINIFGEYEIYVQDIQSISFRLKYSGYEKNYGLLDVVDANSSALYLGLSYNLTNAKISEKNINELSPIIAYGFEQVRWYNEYTSLWSGSSQVLDGNDYAEYVTFGLSGAIGLKKNDLEYKIRLWNMYYNDLKHCSLNKKTPNQMVEELT